MVAGVANGGFVGLASPPILEIELHNSGSRMRKRCKWRWSVQDLGGWIPRKRSQALWVGSAIDRALKAYYDEKSREGYYNLCNEANADAPDWNSGEPFWDEDNARQAAQLALEEYLEQGKEGQVADNVSEDYDTLCNLAREMWIVYLAQLDIAPDDFEVICMGRGFKGHLGDYQDPLTGQYCRFFYAGELDGLILYQGRLYVFENKTSYAPEVLINSLDRDEQASRYHWAVRRMVAAGAFEHLGVPRDTPVWGSMFNILWKRVPKPVQINKPTTKGTLLSKVLHNSWVEEYFNALKEYRPYKWDEKAPTGAHPLTPLDTQRVGTIMPWLPKATTAAALAELTKEWEEQHLPAITKLDNLPWLRRVVVDRNDDMLAQVESQLWAECLEEVDLRLHPEKIFRNPTFGCAIDCPVLDVCNAHLRGQPVEGLLAEFFYRKGDPTAPAVSAVPELTDDEEADGWDNSDDLPF